MIATINGMEDIKLISVDHYNKLCIFSITTNLLKTFNWINKRYHDLQLYFPSGFHQIDDDEKGEVYYGIITIDDYHRKFEDAEEQGFTELSFVPCLNSKVTDLFVTGYLKLIGED